MIVEANVARKGLEAAAVECGKRVESSPEVDGLPVFASTGWVMKNCRIIMG